MQVKIRLFFFTLNMAENESETGSVGEKEKKRAILPRVWRWLSQNVEQPEA